jgi:hypothetical protein
MSTGDLAADELRALVREVLRDALPGVLAPSAPTGPPVGEQTGAGVVQLSTDAELAAFVRRVATECADPQRRDDLAAGRVTYALAAGVRVSPGPDPVPPGPEGPIRVERGAVTERHVRQAARAGTSVVAAAGVVVTPLALDRARSTGVDITRER